MQSWLLFIYCSLSSSIVQKTLKKWKNLLLEDRSYYNCDHILYHESKIIWWNINFLFYKKEKNKLQVVFFFVFKKFLKAVITSRGFSTWTACPAFGTSVTNGESPILFCISTAIFLNFASFSPTTIWSGTLHCFKSSHRDLLWQEMGEEDQFLARVKDRGKFKERNRNLLLPSDARIRQNPSQSVQIFLLQTFAHYLLELWMAS